MTSPIERYREAVEKILVGSSEPLVKDSHFVDLLIAENMVASLQAAALTLARELGLAAIGRTENHRQGNGSAYREDARNDLRSAQRTTLTELTEGGKL